MSLVARIKEEIESAGKFLGGLSVDVRTRGYQFFRHQHQQSDSDRSENHS